MQDDENSPKEPPIQHEFAGDDGAGNRHRPAALGAGEPDEFSEKIWNLVASDRQKFPLSLLTPGMFLPFLRFVEQLVIEQRLPTALTYWSTQSAARLLPTGPRFRELMRDADCVCIFSEDRLDPPDVWCFVLAGCELSLVVCGQQTARTPDGQKYRCCASAESSIVKAVLENLMPRWEQLDLSEANRSKDALAHLVNVGTSTKFAQIVTEKWPKLTEPFNG